MLFPSALTLFENCSSLTSVRLHAAATSFGDNMFNGCSASLVVTCPEGSAADLYCKALNVTVKHEGLSDGGTDPDPGDWGPWF